MPPITSALSNLATALRLRKGEMTRAAIIEAAMGIAARDGLEGLTIGTLADQMQMSKSGVFAHFGSREDLQLAVLKEYVRRFVDEVLRPAVRKPRGLPRLEAILDRWVAFLAREVTRGCIMIAGAVGYDDRPGPQRDAMVAIITGWKGEVLEGVTVEGAEAVRVSDPDFLHRLRRLRSAAGSGRARGRGKTPR